ncbi:MAG TPA: outer membrane protein assembly factor BamA [Candidatus Coprenecus pullistercoris]|nr:outer membrane protein assembly factor BamA [Candidatus Coprenecus pullistercoris]
MMRIGRLLLPAIVLGLSLCGAYAQTSGVEVDYLHPKEYVLGGIRVEGVKYLGEQQIIALTGLKVGSSIEIPGDQTAGVVKRIWAQKHFSDVSLNIDSLSATGDTVYLALHLQERPRVSRWNFQGVKNSEQSELQDRLNLRRGVPLSDYVLRSSVGIITNYYKEKGFLNAEVDVVQVRDTMVSNAVRVTFVVDRKSKVKIKTITFEGNDHVPEGKLVGSMAKTRDMRIRNIFKTKKFNEKEYETDKQSMISVFNEAGFRDARIVKDSIYYVEPDRLGIKFVIDEGKRYYFRNITWTGNSLYTAEQLNKILMIKKGDVYDVVNLQKRLFGDPKKEFMDVHTLYADQGYIFFNLVPVETNIVGDSVDVELRMVEGKPATFNKIIISGNTITNEKVVRRQIFTKPGYLYSQSMLERSLREIASMGNFDPEQALDHTRGYSVIPNQINNTVDITYNVAEKPNSQFELSGGWGGYSFVGTVGVSFNNFSVKRMFKKGAWRPVPLGDAQTLSIRFQTNGTYYTAASVNFMEPWLFGKKPTSFNLAGYYTRQTNSYYFYQNTDEYYEVYGIAASLGSRLKWPDNYFVLYHELSWQAYNLHNWRYNFLFDTGRSNNISYKITLARNSTDQAVYPREGSDFLVSLQLTPPYSLFRDKNTDYAGMTDQQRYRWVEYHKWTFKGALYVKLFDDLVLMTRAQFGYLGYYNRNLGYSPFEGYQVGGDGMSGYNTYGSEIISLRGYSNYSLTPVNDDGIYVGHVYDKFTIELRYPVILQPQSTIYVLAFLEGGNCWENITDFNPFQIKRSAGVGVRIMLPMIGLLGVDWGWGFDPVLGKDRGGSNFHFVIGQQF